MATKSIMDMEYFVNNCDNGLYTHILLYQSNPLLGEKLSKLGDKGKLVNVYVVGLLHKYNNRLIDKLGVKQYIEMINDITEYYDGRIITDVDGWVIKKYWMSVKNKMEILNYLNDK